MAFFKKKVKTEEKGIPEKTARKPELKAASSASTHPRNVKSVLKRPWMSERASLLLAQNKYVFSVLENATKPSVRDEIERRYGVHVVAVNMINRAGKMKRYGSKMSRRDGLRKAIVTLKTGDKIEIQ